jgi:protein transport protein SEC61 subunit beta
MLKLYTDDSPGLRVCVLLHLSSPPVFIIDANNAVIVSSDPFIVLVLSLSFIASIFFLHISAKVIRAFTK